MSLSKILTPYNPGYVLVSAPGHRRGSRTMTGKEPVERQWQQRPRSLQEAAAWVKQGGNLGLLGGHGNLILLDADANADAVEEAEPRLRQTLKITRSTAPDRAKWIVHIDGRLPKSQKAHGKLEILAAGTQGVIVGTHHSGARLEVSGDSVVTLSDDDIAALWQRVVGEPMVQPTAHAVAAEPDSQAVAHGRALVDDVLDRLNVRRTEWRAYDDGAQIAEMEACPFVAATDEPQRQHSHTHTSFVVVGADGKIGAGCHAARCQHAIAQHGSGWRLLRELAGMPAAEPTEPGVDPAVALARNRLIIDCARQWIRRTDLAEHVPLVLQAANGYRTRDTDTAVADAILDVAHEHGRLDRLILTVRDIRRRAGLGSTSTASAALNRMSGWFVVPEEHASDAGDAAMWRIAPEVVAAATDVAYFERNIVDIDTSVSNNAARSIYATLPFVTHRQRDAFTSAQRPITREELAQRRAERQAQIEAGEDVRPLQPSRYRRRLRATVPSLGRGVLRLFDALEECGGAAQRSTLREMLNLSSASLSRLIARAAELGLVHATRYSVTLVDCWREIVDANEPHMPTAGRSLDRHIADLQSNLDYTHRLLRRAGTPEQRHRRLERRRSRLIRQLRELAQRQRPDLPAEHQERVGAGSRYYASGNRGIHTPDRNSAASRLQDAAYWRRIGSLTPAQRGWVEEANRL